MDFSPSPEAMMINSVILPLLGVGIIIFCFLSVFFPFGKRLQANLQSQKLSAFGVDLEVSLFSFLILIGVAMAGSGVYLNIQNYDARLKQAQQKIIEMEMAHQKALLAAEQSFNERLMEIPQRAAELAIRQLQSIDIYAIISLEGIGPDEEFELDDLECRYFVSGARDDGKPAEISRGIGINQFRVFLQDLNFNMHIRRLELRHPPTGRRWAVENFMPLEPVFSLKKES